MMKAKIEQINKYRVTIGDKTYEDFKKVAEWEGILLVKVFLQFFSNLTCRHKENMQHFLS